MLLQKAQAIRNKFFNHYQGLAKWHRDAHARERQVSEGRTGTGRRRLLGIPANFQQSALDLERIPASSQLSGTGLRG